MRTISSRSSNNLTREAGLAFLGRTRKTRCIVDNSLFSMAFLSWSVSDGWVLHLF